MKKFSYKSLGASLLVGGALFTSFNAQADGPTISCEVVGGNLIVTYTGTLYQSTDAVNWTEVASASSPYKVAINDKKLFFCAKGETSKNITIPLSDTVSLDMIWIEPGTFIMGSPSDELGREDDEVQHEVTLTKGYWLGKYEVTQAQYEAVMGSNPSQYIGADLPVDTVNWSDAETFCALLTEQERETGRLPRGYEYTLPTEAQWEYACRAGTTTALNSGKDLSDEEECSEMDEVGWYWYNAGVESYDQGLICTRPVGQKEPNAWGLYDMHGNVYEWCLDWFGDYPTEAMIDPEGPETGKCRVNRGGGWTDRAGDCRSAFRGENFPDSTYNMLGFRVVLAPINRNKTIPLSEDVNLDMIWIEPGTFTMGSPEDELGRRDDEVQHEVTLTQGYWMGKYEVTQAQYEAVMRTNPSGSKGADLPVESVSWNDAKEFCAKLTASEKAVGRLPEGYEYTLPTEAQWEYACRAGTTTALNSGKNLSGYRECPEVDEVGWYWYNSEIDGKRTTHPVGQKLPNAWGLYDMHGNVMEWCSDWYGDYPTSVLTDPTGPGAGSGRVVRDGYWGGDAYYCRSAFRSSSYPSYYYSSRGFRVALAPVPSKNITIPLSDTVDLDLIWIEPGTFLMGSPEDELGRRDNETQHQVTLTKGYWMGKYKVTQAQYHAVMGKNPSKFKGDDLPVEYVSWDDAVMFCAILTAVEKIKGRLPEGYEYTLPTEAQWEYACRAGTATALNSGKNLSDAYKCSEMDEVGWYKYNSDDTTHPVGQKQPNAWGLYDMHGNVNEWCLDWYEKDYPTSSVTDPVVLNEDVWHVHRGGGWYRDASRCRSASRDYDSAPLKASHTGFRVVLAPVK